MSQSVDFGPNALPPSALVRALAAALPAGPVMLWGPPGVGKSAIVAQVAAGIGGCVTAILSQLDPVDVRGLPRIDPAGRAAFAPPSFLPDPERDGPTGILFLDELNTAHQSVQVAAMELIHERRSGDYRLPAGWHVVAAGNRRGDRAAAGRMPSALLNRFAAHLDVRPDLDDWSRWALGAGNVAPEIVAFLRFKTGLLYDFDPAADDRAFATPRSWHALSRLFLAAPDPSVALALYSGCVGGGAAGEFLAFVDVWRRLPSVDAILLDPERAPVPDESEPSVLYALAGSLAAKMTPGNADRAGRYIARVPAEFQVLIFRDAARRDAALIATPTFIGWAAENAALLA